jgi:hypothetical protein
LIDAPTHENFRQNKVGVRIMASIFPSSGVAGRSAAIWHRKMSNNLAAALVVFGGLQIFVISTVVASGATSLLYHIGIAILIAAIIPAARNMERRWELLSQSQSSNLDIVSRYRADQMKLWALTLLLPLAWIPVGALLRLIAG